jgi:hypothetical protein
VAVSEDRHLRPPVPSRRPPAFALRALGKRGLPEQVQINGAIWRLERTVKHDFWAATGFYLDQHRNRAVLKMGRDEPFAGLPLAWVGRFLCRRELRFYRRLADVPNVPALLGTVGRNGFLHAYVPGRPLDRDKPVPDAFFDELQQLMLALHARGIAYVDANKPQNILLGEDGRPHLIDFQISWDSRWLLRRLQQADLYHVLKHKRRMRPDQMSADDWERSKQPGVLIELHRRIVAPYRRLRKRLFKRLRESGRLLPVGSK